MILSVAISTVAILQVSIDAKLMRFPDVTEGKIAFSYGGDIWVVSDQGGVARKLTNSPGIESRPKFSPDGKWIAFTGQYDGNSDVYVMPSEGGEPRRLTYHPQTDLVMDWSPDGNTIYFVSPRASMKGQVPEAYRVSVQGGTPEKLSLGECGALSPSPNGKTFAYNRFSTENATWKRYRGGLQSWISFYDVEQDRYWEMKHDNSAYLWPMWIGDTVYYVNDSDGIRNLYKYDVKTERQSRITQYKNLDITYANSGENRIVYLRDGKLWLYDIQTQKTNEIKVRILSDLVETRPYILNTGRMTTWLSLSPNAVRLALEARGEVYSVPVKEGTTRNISNTPGARERYPTWSPDGKWILYASDRLGEYEFYLQKSDLTEPPLQITTGNVSFVNVPKWSPKSDKFLFTDSTNTLFVVDITTKTKTNIGRGDFGAYSDAVWSPDGTWIAYSKPDPTTFNRLYLYDLGSGKEHLISTGMFNDANPVFDASGKYLFFVSDRNVGFSTDAFEFRPTAVNSQRILGYTLKKDILSPFAPKNEHEKIAEQTVAKPESSEKPQEPKPEQDNTKKEPAIEVEGLLSRLFLVPIQSGSYGLVAAPAGKVLYITEGSLMQFDFASRSSAAILQGFSGLSFTPNFDRVAYLVGGSVGVVPVAPGQQTTAGRVDTNNMQTRVVPREEWEHGYWEAWRYLRDYFWNENMNGINWRSVGDTYAKWLPYVAHRSDLDTILFELLSELATGHAYLQPGGQSGANLVPVGLLGADYEVTASGVRFKKIYRGEPWEGSRRAPLGDPGLNVKEGDLILEIDGEKVTTFTNIFELLEGKADRVVELTIQSVSENKPRKVLVRTTSNESQIRHADWIESRRAYVEKKSGGRIGYIYVPDTQISGFQEFTKMFHPQVDKEALIIDERYNGGGFIPDYIIEKLVRTPLSYWSVRDGGSFRTPGAAHIGPKAMLINRFAGSGGDALPYYFRKRKLGPLIGTTTWGGLIGIMGTRDLMCGGGITVPQFAIWDVNERGQSDWVVENIGVAPDIEIDNRPDLVAKGQDPQLDKAIDYLMEELRKNPPKRPSAPSKPGIR